MGNRCFIYISVTLLFEINLRSPRSSCSYWRVPVHHCQLVRGVLVLLLVRRHLPPAAGAAQLQLAGAVLSSATIVEVRGVALQPELGVEPVSVVLVVLHVRDYP